MRTAGNLQQGKGGWPFDAVIMGQFRNYGFSGVVSEPNTKELFRRRHGRFWSDEVYFAAGRPDGQKSFAVDKTVVVCYLQNIPARIVLHCLSLTFI
jgi:hypothetical protein